GALAGAVTRPISGTNGFALSLGSSSVAISDTLGSRATFDVRVDVDGRPAPLGLAVAGTDALGAAAPEFLWWGVAPGTNGEVLRMPFSYRAVVRLPDAARKAPFLGPIANDATPDEVNGVDHDGRFTLSWSYPAAPAEQPCAFLIERATREANVFTDDAE